MYCQFPPNHDERSPFPKYMPNYCLYSWRQVRFLFGSWIKNSLVKRDFSYLTSFANNKVLYESCWHLFCTQWVEILSTLSKSISKGRSVLKKRGIVVFVICGFINNVLQNSYFILQIYHVKSFEMMHVTSLYFNFSVRYS